MSNLQTPALKRGANENQHAVKRNLLNDTLSDMPSGNEALHALYCATKPLIHPNRQCVLHLACFVWRRNVHFPEPRVSARGL